METLWLVVNICYTLQGHYVFLGVIIDDHPSPKSRVDQIVLGTNSLLDPFKILGTVNGGLRSFLLYNLT